MKEFWVYRKSKWHTNLLRELMRFMGIYITFGFANIWTLSEIVIIMFLFIMYD